MYVLFINILTKSKYEAVPTHGSHDYLLIVCAINTTSMYSYSTDVEVEPFKAALSRVIGLFTDIILLYRSSETHDMLGRQWAVGR